MRFFADWLKNKFSDLVVLIFAKFKEKFNIFVVCANVAKEKGVFADEMVSSFFKIAAGKGGGKKDFASRGVEGFEKKDEIEKVFKNF